MTPLTEIPSLSVFTGGVAGSPDVEAEFETLRVSEDEFDRFSAPGLLHRFWVPTDHEVRAKMLEEFASQDSPMWTAIRGWFFGLGEDTHRRMLSLASAEVLKIKGFITQKAVTDEALARATLTLNAALARDRLESVRRVLAGKGYDLTQELRWLDANIGAHLAQLGETRLADKRLLRVPISDPYAWWAVIG